MIVAYLRLKIKRIFNFTLLILYYFCYYWFAKGKRKNMGNKRPDTRLSDILNEKSVQVYIQEYYDERDKGWYPSTAIARWKKGTHYPPMDVLLGISKILKTNISYLLRLTDISCPNEFEEPEMKHTLEELLAARSITEKELAEKLNKNTVESFKKELPLNRVSSLIKLSSAIDISADYILGLTDWETWEICAKVAKPFKGIEAGSGAYVIAKKGLHSIFEIEEAIRKGDGMYCLLSMDGKSVIFPNGNSLDIDDEMFKGSYVTRVIPEVK